MIGGPGSCDTVNNSTASSSVTNRYDPIGLRTLSEYQKIAPRQMPVFLTALGSGSPSPSISSAFWIFILYISARVALYDSIYSLKHFCACYHFGIYDAVINILGLSSHCIYLIHEYGIRIRRGRILG